MKHQKPTPISREAADRIRSHEAKNNGGKIPPDGFGTRADRVVQQREAAKAPKKP